MIKIIDSSNALDQENFLKQFFRIRYDVFIKRLGWNIPIREEGLETDDFDDEHAIYILITDNEDDRVIGGARLLDTSRRSILGEIFPELVANNPPADPRIFEVTRFTAPRHAAPEDRSRTIELLWGLQAYALSANLTHLVSVSYLSLEPILRRAGYRFSRLGGVHEMDGTKIAALLHDVNTAVLELTGRQLAGSVRFVRPAAAYARRPAGPHLAAWTVEPLESRINQ
jgi:N-acyl-L-homoserine lactone synthetase